MSDDAGDATNRLSDALDEITREHPVDGGDAEAAGDEPYELPPIISATEHPVDDAGVPRLPGREADVAADAPVLPGGPPTQPQAVVAPPAAVPPAAPAAAPTPAAAAPPAAARPAAPVTAPGAGQLRAPGRRPRVRRVTRVLRHIDPWSTFKVALVFSTVAYIVSLTSGVLLWRVADSTGTLANVERWFTQFGWETFELKGGEIFHNAWIIGLFGVVATTGGAVLLVTLFNLVSDIVGGVRMTVLEEEVVERTVSSRRRYVVRSTTTTAPAATTATWSVDDDQPQQEAPATSAPRTTAPAGNTNWSVD